MSSDQAVICMLLDRKKMWRIAARIQYTNLHTLSRLQYTKYFRTLLCCQITPSIFHLIGLKHDGQCDYEVMQHILFLGYKYIKILIAL